MANRIVFVALACYVLLFWPCWPRRMRADKVWNGGWTLNRLNIVGIRLSDYAASQRRPEALRLNGTIKN